MHLPIRSGLFSARTGLTVLWGFVCAMIVAAPVLAERSFHFMTAAVYLFFSRICHQIPERCFLISGHPLAVCHRCSGIYFGLFAGSLIIIPLLHRSPGRRRRWLIAAILPLLIDALLPHTGLWEGSPASRFTTGFLFGFASSQIFVRGVTELLHEFSGRRLLSALCISREALHE
jgi:uncharacterized membrane protein